MGSEMCIRDSLSARETSCDIRISALESIRDSGTWACHLETETGRSHHSESRLQIFRPGVLDIDVFLTPFDVVTGGKPYIIKCTVTGNPVPQPRVSAFVVSGDSGGDSRELLMTSHNSSGSADTVGMFIYKPQIADHRSSVVCKSEQIYGDNIIPESRQSSSKRKIGQIYVPPEIQTPGGPVSQQCYQTNVIHLQVLGYPLPDVNQIHLVQLKPRIR